MNKVIKSFIAVTALIVGLLALTTSPVLQAQATTTSTALNGAITTLNATTFVVQSTTGFVANSTNAVIDAEQMAVIGVNTTSKTITVVRGIASTRATTHATASIVYVAPTNYFTSYPRTGSCTASQENTLPIINATMREYYTCTGGSWARAQLTTLGGYSTFPVTSGGLPMTFSCGIGTTTCSGTATGHTAHIFGGIVPLTAGTGTVSGISPTFTTTSTGFCVSSDTAGGSGTLSKVLITGVSSIQITGSSTDNVAYLCMGW